MEPLLTTSDVIDALGGTGKVARLTGRPMQAVSNWRKSRFPPNTYVILKQSLDAINREAPPVLWGMAQPEAVA